MIKIHRGTGDLVSCSNLSFSGLVLVFAYLEKAFHFHFPFFIHVELSTFGRETSYQIAISARCLTDCFMACFPESQEGFYVWNSLSADKHCGFGGPSRMRGFSDFKVIFIFYLYP